MTQGYRVTNLGYTSINSRVGSYDSFFFPDFQVSEIHTFPPGTCLNYI